MSNTEDEKALYLLEKAVYKAQYSLEQTKHFQPFLLLLTDTGEIEIFENLIEDSTKSYNELEKIAKERVGKGGIDIMVLAVDTMIPDRFMEDVPSGIRIHLEEKSQKENKIAARYLYVPYRLCQVKGAEMFVKLHTPIPVGFPAEYIC